MTHSPAIVLLQGGVALTCFRDIIRAREGAMYRWAQNAWVAKAIRKLTIDEANSLHEALACSEAIAILFAMSISRVGIVLGGDIRCALAFAMQESTASTKFCEEILLGQSGSKRVYRESNLACLLRQVRDILTGQGRRITDLIAEWRETPMSRNSNVAFLDARIDLFAPNLVDPPS